MKFIKKKVETISEEEGKEKAKDLQGFLDANKPKYNEMLWTYEALFNQIGKETDSEALQLAFTGTIIFNMLHSIKCPSDQKITLLKNISHKL